GRADRGGHTWPGAGSPAEAARPDLAALPAVVRVVDAGRVDSDALGRPLRDAAHPYRRVRGVRPRGDAARRAPDQAAAGLRGWPGRWRSAPAIAARSAAGTATRPRSGGLRSCAAGTCATAWSGSD